MDLREGSAFSFFSDGYAATEAESKKDVLKEIAGSGYDMVLLDCNLPS